jgi:4-hydroxy-tetrahydrodipicolinate synthase
MGAAIYRMSAENASGDLGEVEQRLAQASKIVERITFTLNMAAGVEARGFDPTVPKMAVSELTLRTYGEIVAGLRGLFAQRKLEVPA